MRNVFEYSFLNIKQQFYVNKIKLYLACSYINSIGILIYAELCRLCLYYLILI